MAGRASGGVRRSVDELALGRLVGEWRGTRASSRSRCFRRRSRLRSAKWSKTCGTLEPGVSEDIAVAGSSRAMTQLSCDEPRARTSAVGDTIIELPKYITPAGSVPVAFAPMTYTWLSYARARFVSSQMSADRSSADGRQMTSAPCSAVMRQLRVVPVEADDHPDPAESGVDDARVVTRRDPAAARSQFRAERMRLVVGAEDDTVAISEHRRVVDDSAFGTTGVRAPHQVSADLRSDAAKRLDAQVRHDQVPQLFRRTSRRETRGNGLRQDDQLGPDDAAQRRTHDNAESTLVRMVSRLSG